MTELPQEIFYKVLYHFFQWRCTSFTFSVIRFADNKHKTVTMKNISLHKNKECQLLAPPEGTKLLSGISFSEGTGNNIYDWKSIIVTAFESYF
jgi:hypothetical protein